MPNQRHIAHRTVAGRPIVLTAPDPRLVSITYTHEFGQAALPHVDVVPHFSLKYQYRNGSADLSFEAARDFCAAAAEAGARYGDWCFGAWVLMVVY